MTARVARLLLFPVKSLDGQEVTSATVLPCGALAHDRAFAFFESDGRVVNAKRFAALQRLRTRVDLAERVLHLDGERLHLDADRSLLERRIGELLGRAVALSEDRNGGFPDDPAAPGPTVIGTATLDTIAGWFGLDHADVRTRFRANVEVDGVPPFWEDRLFGSGEAAVPFAIGAVGFLGTNPCLRCAVPTRDPRDATPDREFAARFAALRAAHLPPWAPRDRFRPFFRAATNTRRMGGGGGVLRLGDRVTLADTT